MYVYLQQNPCTNTKHFLFPSSLLLFCRMNQSITRDDQDGDDDSNDEDKILAPSFIPFAANNQNESKKVNESKPEQKGRMKGRNKSNGMETDNLAKLYEQQQQQRQQSESQIPSAQQYDAYHEYAPRPNQQFTTPAAFNMGLNMMPPPPTSGNPNRDQALANMLLAWYWNGYYAGYNAANAHRR